MDSQNPFDSLPGGSEPVNGSEPTNDSPMTSRITEMHTDFQMNQGTQNGRSDTSLYISQPDANTIPRIVYRQKPITADPTASLLFQLETSSIPPQQPMDRLYVPLGQLSFQSS
jgi:hypothetical protein